MYFNFKILSFCQRCNREHDRTHESMLETSVKCDYCNGFVVSPTGRSITQIKFTAGIYIVFGETKTAFIGALNKSEALDFFIDEIEEDYHKVEKLTDEQMQEAIFMFDPKTSIQENNVTMISGKDLITLTETLPAAFYVFDNDTMKAESGKMRKDGNEDVL